MKLELYPRLRLAGIFIAIGLIIEILTLAVNSPIGFLIFMGIGGVLMGAGILVYLLALVTREPEKASVAQA